MRRPGRVLMAVAVTALTAGCSAAATAAAGTAPAVTRATVTGYKSGSPAWLSSGPVTVVLRGTTAARLYQVLTSLPAGGTIDCQENVLVYNLTFTLSGSDRTIDVAGYACAAAVQVTQDGTTTLRTDNHCTLAAAVRTALPASAVATRQNSPACDR